MSTFETASERETSRSWIWLIIIWLLATASNLFKPYHIDDTAYLLVSKWISQHPLHPMSGLVNWNGVNEPIYKLLHPHLFLYLLAGWISIFGSAEWSTHVLQSLVALACTVLFYRLAMTLVPSLAIWTTALLVLGPGFVVEQNLMIDLPLLAAWLVFFLALIRGIRSQQQTKRFVVAGVACGAALLIKYSSLTLLPVLVFALIIERRQKQWWCLLIPLFMLAAWSYFNIFDYGHAHIFSVRGTVAREAHLTGDLAIGWIETLGSLHILGMVALAQSKRFWNIQVLVYSVFSLGFAGFVAAVLSGIFSTARADAILQFLFLGNACLAAIPLAAMAYRLFLRSSIKSYGIVHCAPEIYLFSWIILPTIFYVGFAPFVAARHVLIILPPILLLCARYWEASLTSGSQRFALAFTGVISIALCISDWRFAAFFRNEAAVVSKQDEVRQTIGNMRTVWTTGHWGWQWYSQQNGVVEVDVVSSLMQPGDLLIVPREADHSKLVMNRPLRVVQVDTSELPLLSLFCTEGRARMYFSPYRKGAWFLTKDCLQHLDYYRVE